MPRTRIGTPHDHNLRTSSSPSRSPTNRRSSARSEPPVDRSANRGTITSSNPSLQLPSNPQPTQASQLRPHQSTQRKKALNKYAEKIYNRLQEFPTNYTDYRLVDDTCLLSLQSLYDPDPNSQITRPVALPVQDDKNPKKKINFRIYDYNELYQAYQHQMKGDLPEDGWKGIFLTFDEIPPPETWLRCDSPEFKNFFQTQIKRDNIENKPSTSTSIPASISEASTSTSIPASISEASTSTSRKQRKAPINPFVDTIEPPSIFGSSDIPGPSGITFPNEFKVFKQKITGSLERTALKNRALQLMEKTDSLVSEIAKSRKKPTSLFSKISKRNPSKLSQNPIQIKHDLLKKLFEIDSIKGRTKEAIFILYSIYCNNNEDKIQDSHESYPKNDINEDIRSNLYMFKNDFQTMFMNINTKYSREFNMESRNEPVFHLPQEIAPHFFKTYSDDINDKDIQEALEKAKSALMQNPEIDEKKIRKLLV
jgi:hypothetical protein